MSLLAVAGQKFYIGHVMEDSASDFIETDFTSIHASPNAWTEVDGWETMGAIGDAVTDIKTDLINRNRAIHQKGTADSPAMSNVFALIADDAGQLAVRAAGQPSVKDSYAFRIKGNESGTASEIYFIALVMGTPEQGGGANTVRKLAINLQPNSNFVFVAAA